MTVRNIFATIVVALIAGIGYSIKEKIVISFGIPFAPVLSCAAIFIAALFYFVDRYWYHRLLVGSVKEAMRLEEEISKISDIEIRLSRQISEESPVVLPKPVEVFASYFITEERFVESKKLHSDGKIEFFYKSIMIMFGVIAVLTLCVKTS
jgi:hypothetical protein